MPLILAPLNIDIKIVKIVSEEAVKKHLESLGFMVGQTIKVIANQGGNIIVSILGAKLCLDKVLASKVHVIVA